MGEQRTPPKDSTLDVLLDELEEESATTAEIDASQLIDSDTSPTSRYPAQSAPPPPPRSVPPPPPHSVPPPPPKAASAKAAPPKAPPKPAPKAAPPKAAPPEAPKAPPPVAAKPKPAAPKPATPPKAPPPRPPRPGVHPDHRDEASVEVNVDDLEEVPDSAAAYPAEALEAARLQVERCEEELKHDPEPQRASHLHYEIARLFEAPLGDLRRAAAHYQEALRLAPEHVPTIRGARRVLLSRRSYQRALELFDDEARITSDPRRKAALLHSKGVLLEDVLGRKDEARLAFQTALELDRADGAALRSLTDSYIDGEDERDLERTLEQAANAVSDDPRHRAALVARRARLVEGEFPERATELYEIALRLDPRAPGALSALKRLHHAQRRWRDLIRVLGLEADLTEDPSVQTMALYRMGRLHVERLGNQAEAIAVLERAAKVSPDDPLILGELARLYERGGRWDALASVLQRLVQNTRDPQERLGLLHRIGLIHDERLGREDAAIHWYASALTLDATNVPTLQALARIYRRQEQWEALVQMHLSEGEATEEAKRRAAAHARAAEILEEQLQRVEEAIEHHNRSLAAVPDYAPSFKALTRLFAELGRWRELIELHERAVDLSGTPTHAITHLFKIGAIYEDAIGEPAQALHAYRRVLDLDPDHLGAIHALQRAAERAGRSRELVEALELEVEKTRDQGNVVALLHRAGELLEERLNDRPAALERYRRVLDIDPRYVPALTSIGRLYHAAGRWEDLLDTYERELELTPRGPAAVTLLQKMGELCEDRIGREDQAIQCYRRAIELDPTHGPSLRALTRKLQDRGDWEALVEVLTLELSGSSDPALRARTAYRIGQVREERLEQHDPAIKSYEQALQEVPGYRPALDALTRLRAQSKSWGALVGDLTREAKETADESLSTDALMRQGQVWAYELGEPRKAITCFEKVLEAAPTHLGALMALEELYRRVGAWDALVRVYAAEAKVFVDPGARIGALRAQARVLEARARATPESLAEVYTAILDIDPSDERALQGLERIAIVTGDPRRLAEVDRRFAHTLEGAVLRAAHITRLGESLEALGSGGALEAYREALQLDQANLGATRGLTRLAEATDDPVVLAEAARQEAALAKDTVAAARLLVRSAGVRTERLGDYEGAVADLERALELHPDSPQAAALLSRLLRSQGEAQRLSELLARAAGSCSSQDRAAELWMEVAGLFADELDNLAGGIVALNRVLRATPSHVPTLRRLAVYYQRDGQWSESVSLLNRVVQLAPDRDALKDAHLQLAELWSEHLGDGARALVSLQAVLALDPGHRGALARLAELYEREGRVDDAVETVRQLLAAATDAHPRERAAALVRLARLERTRGNEGGASDALRDAVALEGPGSESALECKALVREATDWQAYVSALEQYLRNAPDVPAKVATYLELARVMHDHLQQVERAIRFLEKGIEASGGDAQLERELALRLRMAGQPERAIETLQNLVTNDLGRAELWREMARTFRDMGLPVEARVAAGPLVLLGQATEREQAWIREAPPRPLSARPGSMSRDLLDRLGTPSKEQQAAGNLLRALEPALTKLFPPDLESFGLSSRDKITSKQNHPLRQIADEIGKVFGVEAFDLYLHRVRTRGLEIELGSPTMLIVPAGVTELPEAQQVFLLARPMAQLARGFAPVEKLTPRELEVLLASAARQVRDRYGAGLTSEDYLEEQSKRLHKALGRKGRKTAEEIAQQYVESARVDFERFVRAAKRTAIRAAALLTDDLEASIDVMRRTERDLQGLDFAGLLRSSDHVADLVAFWSSKAANHLRRHTGMVR